MNTVAVIYNYDSIISHLVEDIKKSNYKVNYFLKLLDLKPSFFYKKLREKRFTSTEMKLIAKHLYPEEYQEYKDTLISQFLEASKKQLKEGKGVDFETVLRESKAKYSIV